MLCMHHLQAKRGVGHFPGPERVNRYRFFWGFFNVFIGVYLLYNGVLVSAV